MAQVEATGGGLSSPIATMRRGLELAYRAAPRLLITSTVLQLVAGLATIVAVFLGGRFLDELVRDTDDSSLAVLTGFGAATAIALGASLAKSELARVLAERTERHATDVVLQASVRAEPIAYEHPEFHDKLLRALDAASWRPAQLTGALLSLVVTMTTVIGLGIAVLTLSPLLFVLVFAGVVPLAWVARRVTAHTYRFHVAQTERDRRRGYFLDALSDRQRAAEVRVFGVGDRLRTRVAELHDRRLDDLRRLVRYRTLHGLFGVAVTVAAACAVLYVLDRQIGRGDLEIDDAAIVAVALLVLAQRLQALASAAASVLECAVFLGDIDHFAAAVPQAQTVSSQRLQSLEVDQVSFTYPAGEHPAIEAIELELRPGQLVALVGENGSGKTTLAKVLSFLYAPSSGQLKVNGTPVIDPVASPWSQRVAIVDQAFLRLLMTAGENIALGDLDAAGDRERLDAAAEFGDARSAIERLPEGYATLLGTEFSGGHELSGGQWQRLAIARAWFRNADLLVLDEPTSSLDPTAELELVERLRRLADDKIVVLISHRFGTVAQADHIVVLHDGHIAERGSHDELMAESGRYAALYSAQAQAFEQRR